MVFGALYTGKEESSLEQKYVCYSCVASSEFSMDHHIARVGTYYTQGPGALGGTT